MKLVIFGLTVTSSWANGHTTLWRGLLGSLARLGHEIVFFERDVPYYAAQRDLHRSPCYRIVLYPRWNDVIADAARAVERADVAIVTSYCPDAIAAADLVTAADAPLSVFYDLDTRVTLDRLARGDGADGLLPVGTAVRSGSVRDTDRDRRLGGARRVLRAGKDHVDAGTLPGYRGALTMLAAHGLDSATTKALDA